MGPFCASGVAVSPCCPPPPRSHKRAALFQRGATDLFHFTGPDIGRLRCVTLRTVERGLLGTACYGAPP